MPSRVPGNGGQEENMNQAAAPTDKGEVAPASGGDVGEDAPASGSDEGSNRRRSARDRKEP